MAYYDNDLPAGVKNFTCVSCAEKESAAGNGEIGDLEILPGNKSAPAETSAPTRNSNHDVLGTKIPQFTLDEFASAMKSAINLDALANAVEIRVRKTIKEEMQTSQLQRELQVQKQCVALLREETKSLTDLLKNLVKRIDPADLTTDEFIQLMPYGIEAEELKQPTENPE